MQLVEDDRQTHALRAAEDRRRALPRDRLEVRHHAGIRVGPGAFDRVDGAVASLDGDDAVVGRTGNVAFSSAGSPMNSKLPRVRTRFGCRRKYGVGIKSTCSAELFEFR